MSKLRQERTAHQIRVLLSELLLRNTRDPRLQDVTITEVQIDRELQYADVYVNALGDESRQEEVMAALEKAAAYLRRELGPRLQLRTVPNLHFHWDPTLAHAEYISQLLDSLDIPAEDSDEEE
jgi:ribosome-binding factor A